MGRKGWILVGLLLVAIPAADAIWWRIAIGRVETGFNAWAARARLSDSSISGTSASTSTSHVTMACC